MSRGISVHIGLNVVDPNAYDGWDGQLSGCINDAYAMQRIADQMGYSSALLLDGQATSGGVVEQIGRAAQQLQPGDTFLLTYSGHGGQVPDVNGDEDDGQDETWVLYDRMLVDDELYSLWGQFQAGVRIFMLSDSCHSGTMLKNRSYSLLSRETPPKFRLIPEEKQRAAYQRNQATYNAAQWACVRGDRGTIGASIIYMSGCQDNQLSADGATNGLFTSKVLEVWNNGQVGPGYYQFWKEVAQRMPPEQSPNYYKLGIDNPVFESEKPFSLAGGASPQPVSGGPTVQGAAQWERGVTPPTFQVNPGPNPYYIFEITSQPTLFDVEGHGHERTAANFYGTWADPSQPARLTGASFTLPAAAWLVLQQASQLYYRVGSTSSYSGWDNYMVSTPDLAGVSAPMLQVTGGTPIGPDPSPQDEPVLRRGATGPAVRRLQELLYQHGYGLTVDGDFGPRTEQAVRSFQAERGLTVDGVVGPRTWAELKARVRTAPVAYAVMA